MLRALRRHAARWLPEPLLRRLVQLQHGELSHQQRLRGAGAVPDGYLRVRALDGQVLARVVGRFAAEVWRDETARALIAALDDAGVGVVALPAPRGLIRSLGVAAEDELATLRALDTLPGLEWQVRRRRPEPGSGMPVRPITRADHRGQPETVEASRSACSSTGQLLMGSDAAVRLEFWRQIDRDDVERIDGERHEAGTRIAPEPNLVVGYLSPANWSAAVGSPAHWPVDRPRPHVFDVTEPIDLVYTWVNGADPAWQQRKAACAQSPGDHTRNATAAIEARFASYDELRYSLRSVAMYASWVRHIYLVTDGQRPEWLDASHPKISVIDHTEIFTDPVALPVFNSHAIESQLHHIDGLSEHYLYLNDDFFFGRPVAPEAFFHGNGIAKFFLSPGTLDLDEPSSRDLPVMSAAKRNRALLEAEFGVTITQKFRHTPQPQVRGVLAEMERRHPDVFDQVSRSRFRHPDDVSITSALHHYYAYRIGRAVPDDIGYSYQDISLPNTARRLDSFLRLRPEVYCLNDGSSTPDTAQQRHRMLAEFFRQYYPVPSPYELPGTDA
ncbi:MAG: stealth family protein [Jatrophihabitans sp.]